MLAILWLGWPWPEPFADGFDAQGRALLTLAVCSGGLRTVVTPRRLVLRAGRFGPPLLRLATSDIAEVAVPDFDPVRDFGGWGIKRGLVGPFARAWAFNFGGSGVLVRTRRGRRYLIGTDQPDRLAAALNAARSGPERLHH